MPNFNSQISSANKAKKIPPVESIEANCNCPNKEECHVSNQCQKPNLIYVETVKDEDGQEETYTGLTSNTFKN